jgi:hypothetical protein
MSAQPRPNEQETAQKELAGMMHGGADGSGAPKGEKNGNYKHGRYTKDVAATRSWLREAAHMLRDLNKRT